MITHRQLDADLTHLGKSDKYDVEYLLKLIEYSAFNMSTGVIDKFGDKLNLGEVKLKEDNEFYSDALAYIVGEVGENIKPYAERLRLCFV